MSVIYSYKKVHRYVTCMIEEQQEAAAKAENHRSYSICIRHILYPPSKIKTTEKTALTSQS